MSPRLPVCSVVEWQSEFLWLSGMTPLCLCACVSPAAPLRRRSSTHLLRHPFSSKGLQSGVDVSAYMHRMVDLVRTVDAGLLFLFTASVSSESLPCSLSPAAVCCFAAPAPQSERLLSLAQMFVAHYYTLFDQEPHQRGALGGLYHPSSVVTIYGRRLQGAHEVTHGLAQMEYTTHVSWNVDCQPYMGDGCMMLVTGNVRVGGERTPVGFTEMFALLPSPEANGAWYVCNQARQMV